MFIKQKNEIFQNRGRPQGNIDKNFVVAMNRVDVVELVVDLVDVNLDINLVDVDLDVDLVDFDLVDIPFETLLSHNSGSRSPFETLTNAFGSIFQN